MPARTQTAPADAERTAVQKRRLRRSYLTAYAFLAPWFIGLIVIVIGPMLASLVLSFTRYDLLSPPQWAGFSNYVRMFTTDTKFMKSVGVTAMYTGIAVPGILLISLLLALYLNRGMRGTSVYRTMFYIPYLLGGSVAIAILWLQVWGQKGMFNMVLSWFGIKGKSWIGSPNTALLTVAFLAIWTFGSTMVIFLAGLRQIPQSYYEAAQIDGANRWQQFWNITFPNLTPIIFFNGLLTIVNALQSFTPAYVISGGTGSPANALLVYTVYLYQQGFVNYNMGYAAAMGWVLVAALAIVAGVLFWSSKYWVFYGEEA